MRSTRTPSRRTLTAATVVDRRRGTTPATREGGPTADEKGIEPSMLDGAGAKYVLGVAGNSGGSSGKPDAHLKCEGAGQVPGGARPRRGRSGAGR